ncbi:MAG: tRNA 2-thiocytidine(32) synthetase TtcA, partial [Clostridiales bacterium]|nr:tRNA 2-thiocytidine(32) synthetase TtcA [Clostridiales bacterium]
QPLSKFKYRLAAGHIGLGFPGEDVSSLAEYCYRLDVPFFHEKTQIGPLVFEVRRESNPCSLCAKLQRGALNNLALANGYSKVALGHHQDDVLETLLLKTFFEGNIAAFNPVTYLDRKGVTVIRPFVYAPEALVAYVARACDLPVMPSLCPASGQTRRQDMKEFLKELDALSPEAKDRAISALERLFGDKWDGGRI